MRTEFGEGLTLEAAAAEASIEVVAPDRTLALTRRDGSVLRGVGPALRSRRHCRRSTRLAQPSTIAGRTGELARAAPGRSITRGHRYRAVVVAPLDDAAAHSTPRWCARCHRRADRPARGRRRRLADRPADAEAADADGGAGEPHRRARPERAAGRAAGRRRARRSWRRRSTGCSIASPSALHQQRQFMADASHELRTPVSVVRTAAQVTLAKEVRSAEEYRESLVIVGEQAGRLSRWSTRCSCSRAPRRRASRSAVSS